MEICMNYGVYTISLIILHISSIVSQIFKNKKLCTCILCGLTLALLLGLRNPYTVGVDGMRYYNSYLNTKGQSISVIFYLRDGGYLLFYFLFWFFSNIGLPFEYFTLILGLFCVFITSLIIYKFSERPLLSFILYLGLGFYTFSFSGLKQSLAMTFVLLTFFFIHKRKPLSAAFLMLLAFLSHPTSAVFIPLLFINKIKMNQKTMLLTFPFLVLAFAFRIQIAHLLTVIADDEYVGKYEISGGIGGTSIFILLALIFYVFSAEHIFKNHNSVTNDNKMLLEKSFLFIGICSLIIQFFSAYAYAFTRLNFYYFQFFTIIIPYSLNTNRTKIFFDRYYRVFQIFFYLLIFYMMISKFYSHINGEKIIDYEFFWK